MLEVSVSSLIDGVSQPVTDLAEVDGLDAVLQVVRKGGGILDLVRLKRKWEAAVVGRSSNHRLAA